MPRAPDAQRARAAYRRHAAHYDDRRSVRVIEDLQRRAVEQLELSPGARVLDVACGTGLAFDRIEAAIGPEGELVGVDLSAAMLEQAAERARDRGWDNVRLVEAAVEDASLGAGDFDGALFSFCHDVLRSRDAVDAVARAVRGGGRIATTGIQWAPRWMLPVNAAVWLGARRYVTTFDGFDRPYSLLADQLADVRVERAWLGSMYVVSGRVPT